MRRTRGREFWCHVVSEAVLIQLKRPVGLRQLSDYFVQCNQTDCQYVEVNRPPCPLNVRMFSDEIKAGEAVRAARHDGD